MKKFKDVWDMRGLEFGTSVDFHGIQCAIGTRYAAKIYDILRAYTPDKDRALQYVKTFDYSAYKEKLRSFLGKSAEAMIALEEKEEKYSLEKHAKRIEIILANWDKIVDIIKEEVPTAKEIENILDIINAPKNIEEIGIDKAILPMTFEATKDIRDKYVLSRLCHDLGIMNVAQSALTA